MSDDPILAALARLEAGQEALADRMDRVQQEQAGLRAEVRDRFDRLEGKVDRLAAEVLHLGPRVAALESDAGGQLVRAGTAHGRINDLAVRVELIERRLELRDQA